MTITDTPGAETAVPLDVAATRRRFPALAAMGPAGRPIVHTDAPGGTQVLDDVLEAMRAYLVEDNANAHGAFPPSVRTQAMCDEVRAEVGALFGSEAESVVFGANMTTLAWHLSHALDARVGEGDEVVCTQLDHDANIAPWVALARRRGASVRWVPLRPDGTLDDAALADVVTERTRLVALPAASNVLGTLVDPAPYVAAARRVGAVTVLDAVHAAPHVAVDRRALGVDVLLCSPYKFFGPHAGLLIADPALLAELPVDKVRPSPDSGPERWQTGTASFEAIAGTGAAVRYLADVGMARVREHEVGLARRFLAGLAELGHVRLHGPAGAEARTPTFAVTLDGLAPQAATDALTEQGIWTWAGHAYAVEPVRALGLLDSGGVLRIGFVHYHGHDDVDRVLDALASLAT